MFTLPNLLVTNGLHLRERACVLYFLLQLGKKILGEGLTKDAIRKRIGGGSFIARSARR
jgi:hypothetical protein